MKESGFSQNTKVLRSYKRTSTINRAVIPAAGLGTSSFLQQRSSQKEMLLANPGSRGFVGRDLMLRFPFSILLSGKKQRSRVLLE